MGRTDNTSFSVKPVDSLAVGTHKATITVTDIGNKTLTASTKFKLNNDMY